ncbi:MAG TPA: Ig-like domain-containing domain, partial [Bacteroidales bacterium]|nr:Ig-like domain-containing domain [Bacteroidales bacterium]
MLIVFYQRIRVFVPIIGASLLVFILANCARESRPTGGMKDTTAPQVVLEKPLNNSVLVAPKKVVIAFNESVTLDKIQEQCIISPSLSEFPKISAKKNKVTISLHKTTLQPNTTYSFTFSKAIKDVNEGNTLESYSYAFSTSSVIDSCKIAGKVLYAQSLNIPKNAYVLLYSNLSESAVKTQKPNYITQVTRDGSFQFNNIAAGTYAIYALEDANRDFMFNQATEKIAFLNQPITPTAQRVIDTVWYSRKIDSIPQSIDSFATKYITRWSHQDIELYLFENKIQQLSIYNAKRISQFSYGWKFSK